LRSVERLEKFWRNLVLAFPFTTDLKGAVVTYYPEVPFFLLNHAADINVNEGKAEDLLNRVTEYFKVRGFPFVCFRISPLTRPRSFASLLESHGFERKVEHSIMVFKGEGLENKLNPDVKVKEISESEIDLYNKLLSTSFEMPVEWKRGWDKFILECIKKGAKGYLAYMDGRPVGTSAMWSLEKTGGIFNVGTLKEHRRQGIGTTLTVHALIDSIKEGNTLHTLQTDKGGDAERLYRKIGFEIDLTISWFIKKF